MLKINGADFYNAISTCTYIETVNKEVEKNSTRKGEMKNLIVSDDKKKMYVYLMDIRAQLGILDAKLSGITVGKALALLKKKNCTYGDLAEIIKELSVRFGDELATASIFVMNRNMEVYFESKVPQFGQEVSDKFPSSNYDIEEAGKCFALRRSTACVTHLMRAIEPALASLAKPFGIKFEHTNWNTILDQVDKTVKTIGAGPGPHAKDWKQEQQFYSEAAVHLRLIKDAWRNYAMHQNDRYDEERAEAIFLNVRSLMRHLAIRLSE
jgi:hypothetical protein